MIDEVNLDAQHLMSFIMYMKSIGKSRNSVKATLDSTIDGFLDMVYMNE